MAPQVCSAIKEDGGLSALKPFLAFPMNQKPVLLALNIVDHSPSLILWSKECNRFTNC